MNKRIQLCGIGNALVDLQFEVSTADVAELGLTKGQMLLAGIENQEELLTKLKGRKFHKSSGGSAANTVIAFSKFGGRAAYLTSLGKDDMGDFYAGEFEELGINLAARRTEQLPTGTCIVLITPDSDRTMHTCLGASSAFDESHVSADIIADSEWLYLEGYEFSSPEGQSACFRAMEKAIENGTKISLSFSDYFITDNFRDALKKVATKSELVFCNHHEALSYSQADNTEKAMEIIGSECPCVVMTMGEKGSLVKWYDKLYEIPAVRVNAIDSTGAGDMFAGSFLYGMIASRDIEKAARLASLAAAKVVSQIGARFTGDHKQLYREIYHS